MLRLQQGSKNNLIKSRTVETNAFDRQSIAALAATHQRQPPLSDSNKGQGWWLSPERSDPLWLRHCDAVALSIIESDSVSKPL
mmetsp:Transcript_59074/g.125499  ORF Transcript_59074/g.125499 Transcript_59074/m.125499 type:complete len:83 (-) Transcript_59074:225-473(-)